MASIYDDIRKSLENHLNNVSGLPDIAWENVPYSPTTGTSFIAPVFIPVTRRPAHRGLNPQMRYSGLFSINCYCPENKGPKEASDVANTVIEAFEATSDIDYNGTIVHIDYAERQQGILNSPWYFIPVDIGWFIFN